MVEFQISTGHLSAIAGSVLLLVFAIIVGGLGKFRGSARWFSLYGGGFAAVTLINSLYVSTSGGTYAYGLSFGQYAMVTIVGEILWVTMFYGLYRLVRCYSDIDWIRSPWLWVLAGIPAVLLAAVNVGFWPELQPREILLDIFTGWGINLAPHIMALAAALLAVQYRRAPRRELVIMGSALIAFPAAWSIYVYADIIPTGVMADWTPFFAMRALVDQILVWVPIAVWIWAYHFTRQSGALGVAFVGIGFAWLGVLLGAYTHLAVSGFARAFDVVVVAYAILRHQYLSLDLRVRWTVSKSTVAAVVVAVVFAASEATQLFFGNQWYGITAGALIVFGLAPLQRLADRLAHKAIPLSAGEAPVAYRQAILAALRDDGKIGPREEQHLADLAQTLGLGAGDAVRIRQEMAREL